MKVITPVNSFKTTDGKLFEDRNKAIDHQRKINIEEGLKSFFNVASNLNEIEIEEAIEAIVKNIEELKKIINQ